MCLVISTEIIVRFAFREEFGVDMAKDTDNDADSDNLDLEASFPEAHEVFAPYGIAISADESVLVMLDTNVLLLPYQTTQDDLAAIGVVYDRLAAANRLFIAGRAAREFAKHRDRKLAEMVKTIGDIKSRLPNMDKRLSPLLVGLDGYPELEAAHDELMTAKTSYSKALEPLIKTIRDWKGNDPVSTMYARLFTAARIVEAKGSKDDLQAEWKRRSDTKQPPGYKDSSKLDGGIGDFLIWKSALTLAESQKKDLVFVTNEKKPDWFIRSNGEPLYPRLELVDEYRRHSDGKRVRLCSLHQLLREMNVDEKVVEEVRSAEVVANSSPSVVSSHRRLISGQQTINYSTNDGRASVVYGYQKQFLLRFSRSGGNSIHIYRAVSSVRVGRIKSPPSGFRVYFDSIDTSSSSYTLEVGDGFAVLNADGYMLVGRILSVSSDLHGGTSDEVTFSYNVSAPEDPGEVP